MSVLSGLSNLGLGKFENASVFENEEEKKEEAVKAAKPQVSESDFLLDKTYVCKVCDNEFKNRTLKANKARLIGQDSDLRPRYENIDPLKYDVVVCPKCGYAALTRYFNVITPPQAKLVKDNISKSFKGLKYPKEIPYENAIERYQLALANAIVKRGKASERAFICLRMAWVVRGRMESYDRMAADYDAVVKECRDDENELLTNALDGFMSARQQESFPMCGMDENTVDYIIAVLAARFGKTDIASRMIGSILQSASANNRLKDRARDLKEEIINSKK